ncbi:MAG: hypothetical protein LBD45_03425 [Bacteroidales bacterium]|nr:hypothetical protein [Bacteroidales bacterium]
MHTNCRSVSVRFFLINPSLCEIRGRDVGAVRTETYNRDKLQSVTELVESN